MASDSGIGQPTPQLWQPMDIAQHSGAAAGIEHADMQHRAWRGPALGEQHDSRLAVETTPDLHVREFASSHPVVPAGQVMLSASRGMATAGVEAEDAVTSAGASMQTNGHYREEPEGTACFEQGQLAVGAIASESIALNSTHADSVAIRAQDNGELQSRAFEAQPPAPAAAPYQVSGLAEDDGARQSAGFAAEMLVAGC